MLIFSGCWQAPPLAAALGETFQGYMQGPPGVWLVYAEQTDVGPPRTLFSISDPGAPLQVWGHLSFVTTYQVGAPSNISGLRGPLGAPLDEPGAPLRGLEGGGGPYMSLCFWVFERCSKTDALLMLRGQSPLSSLTARSSLSLCPLYT